MAKYCGKIAFGEDYEASQSVWKKRIVSRQYYGDVINTSRRYDQSTDTVNGKISTSDKISVVADAYAMSHFYNILWVEYMGAKWIAKDVSVSRPRLTITLGGLYNGKD